MDSTTIQELALRAKAAYEPPAGVRILRNDADESRGYMAVEDGSVVVAISGTKSLRDFFIDLSALRMHIRMAHVRRRHKSGGLVHAGFWDEYQSIKEQIVTFWSAYPGMPVRFTGHSMGAALAGMAAADAAAADREVQYLGLAGPRFCDEFYANWFGRLGIDALRIVHDYDLVPRVPKLGYVHVGELLHLDQKGREVTALRGFLSLLLRPAVLLLTDLEGLSLEEHHIDRYLFVLNRYFSFVKGGSA